MAVLIKTTSEQTAAEWKRLLLRDLGAWDVHIWPDIPAPADIRYALVWRPMPGFFASYPRLKAIVSLAAGIDHLRNDPSLPPDIPIIRSTGRPLARQLTEYVLYYALRFHRGFDVYQHQQRERVWKAHAYALAPERRVGVMGLGAIGSEIASTFHGMGFDVAGWSRSAKALPFPTYAGVAQLHGFLHRSDIVICVLPLTRETTGLLDSAAFAAMPAGGLFINIGRGPLVDEDALLHALNREHLAAAVLDVFEIEPLPCNSPLWTHPRITLTPHIAGDVQPSWGAPAAAQAIRRMEAGEPIANVTNSDVGY